MLAATRRSVVVSAMLTALAILLLANSTLLAQTPTPAITGTPVRGEMNMDMASPAAGAAPMDQMMVQMMEQCMAMMKMMMDMMGGDMSGMMGADGAGMESMGGMATPTATSSP